MSLKSGMTITIVPEPPQAPSKPDWRNSVGTMQDTPSFRAMIAEGERSVKRMKKQLESALARLNS